MKFPPKVETVEQKRAYCLGMVHTLWNFSWFTEGVQYVGMHGNAKPYSDAFFEIVNGFKQATGEDLGSTSKQPEGL